MLFAYNEFSKRYINLIGEHDSRAGRAIEQSNMFTLNNRNVNRHIVIRRRYLIMSALFIRKHAGLAQ